MRHGETFGSGRKTTICSRVSRGKDASLQKRDVSKRTGTEPRHRLIGGRPDGSGRVLWGMLGLNGPQGGMTGAPMILMITVETPRSPMVVGGGAVDGTGPEVGGD